MGHPNRTHAAARLGAWSGAVALLGCLFAASASGAPTAAPTAGAPAAVSAGGSPTITEFSNGVATNAEPLSITAGPEAAVSFGEHSPVGAVGSLSLLSGAISSHATLNGAPVIAVTRGPEGNIWFSESSGAAKLGMIEPASGIIVEYPQPPSARITAMTSGPEGDIWFVTENGAQSAIGRLVPVSGNITEFSFHADRKPVGITVGAEGNLFVASSNPGAIVELSVATKSMEEYPLSSPAAVPTGITTGAEGDIWFTQPTASGAVGRLVPAGGQVTEYSAGLTQGKLQGIALGSDGNLYVAEAGNNGAIAQVTPQGTIRELTEGLTPKSEPWAIAPGPDGNVYFTERGKPARIGRISLPTAHATGGGPGGGQGEHPSGGPGSARTEAQVAEEAMLGSLSGASPTSGTVLFRNSSGRLVPLSGPKVLPLGTVIDATSGVVRMITALSKRGKTQTVTVWGGVFKITQRKHGDGLTQIHLSGALPRCSTHARGAGVASSKTAHKSRKLWAKDEHGSYSTHGASSVATVLGTEWETVDSCAGTSTRVLTGEVRVLDLHRHKAVLVRAGHSYLARR
jgi:virginiamycin B lyase